MHHSTLPRFAFPLLAAVAVLSGCSSSDESSNATQEIDVARSSLQRDLAPNLTDDERTAFAESRADFGVELLRNVAGAHAKNSIVSPHSASIALAMTYAGSGGSTKDGMAKALRFSLSDARLHAAFNATDLQLASRQKGSVSISSANSLWSQRDGEPYDPSFLDTLAVSYGAGVNLLDFKLDAGASAARTINGWVSERTQEKIPKLLEASQVSNVKWVLVNALYLKADWQSKFEAIGTSDAPFTTATGATVQVPMMHQTGTMRAVHRDDYDAIEMPYEGDQLAMVAIVPAAGTFATFASRLTGKTLLDLPLEPQLVGLSFPKLDMRTHVELTEPLGAMGMPLEGDFPGDAIKIKVIQETMLVADEKGTEAAAATAVIGAGSSGPIDDPPKPLLISVDRPFVYAIIDKPTGAVLFLGETVDPTAK